MSKKQNKVKKTEMEMLQHYLFIVGRETNFMKFDSNTQIVIKTFISYKR